jgi:hypothetical protein
MTHNHYLLFDNSVQWFIGITSVEINAPDKQSQVIDVPSEVSNSAFVSNLCSREQAFSNRHFGDNTWVGYAISEQEFNRVKRLVALTNPLKEFYKLASYP